MHIIDELQWRGLVKDHTDLGKLRQLLSQKSVTLYCGYDPTADSLHLGSLQMIVTMRRFQLAGHRVIALSGGATGLIGDPSGRTDERTLKSAATVKEWAELIAAQLHRLLPANAGQHPPIFADNLSWTAGLSVIEFLRDIGKNFSVNYMLAKDSVTSRLDSGGLSFTEFSYMLLQAHDYLVLSQRHGCELQIGGSDQWGNITAGITLAGKHGYECHGLTSPLMLRADGKKFGKSEAGAIWLEKSKTSAFSMFQYLLNTTDSEVISLLKRLTFLDSHEIDELESSLLTSPQNRSAQRALANLVVTFVHGQEAAARAAALSDSLFVTGVLTAEQIQDLAGDLIGLSIYELDENTNITWEQLLFEAGIATSKAEARRLIDGGGISIWDQRVKNSRDIVDARQHQRGNILLVSKGKRGRFPIKLTD